ncbi:MAG: dienelactone hydrolase family protein [Endomicrobiales bacterium]
MDKSRHHRSAIPEVEEQTVKIPAGETHLDGDLVIPRNARGLVFFAHGSGSSRRSPRNRYVAGFLQAAGIATLLFDLLTPEEEAVDRVSGELRFNIELLSRRLLAATWWALRQSDTSEFPLGYFGASTGAAAALVAASIQPGEVKAVVSRGGRPDLAGKALSRVRAPTLFIVGGEDEVVIELNRSAAGLMSAPHAVEIVPGATHLFEEPGKLDEVSRLAADWFSRYLK